LQKLKYDFLQKDLKESVAVALRFTLSVPGIHTAIVGTSKPGRFGENAAVLAAGPLPKDVFETIRTHWREIASDHWLGQIDLIRVYRHRRHSLTRQAGLK